MSNVHADPAATGTRFGVAVVTVDAAAGDCVIHAPRPGPAGDVMTRKRFDSLDEVQGAYAVQIARAAIDPVAGDIARALKFAGQQIAAAQQGSNL